MNIKKISDADIRSRITTSELVEAGQVVHNQIREGAVLTNGKITVVVAASLARKTIRPMSMPSVGDDAGWGRISIEALFA